MRCMCLVSPAKCHPVKTLRIEVLIPEHIHISSFSISHISLECDVLQDVDHRTEIACDIFLP